MCPGFALFWDKRCLSRRGAGRGERERREGGEKGRREGGEEGVALFRKVRAGEGSQFGLVKVLMCFLVKAFCPSVVQLHLFLIA